MDDKLRVAQQEAVQLQYQLQARLEEAKAQAAYMQKELQNRQVCSWNKCIWRLLFILLRVLLTYNKTGLTARMQKTCF